MHHFSCPLGNQLQQVLTGPVISATMNLPLPLACSLLQQHVNAALQGQAANGEFSERAELLFRTCSFIKNNHCMILHRNVFFYMILYKNVLYYLN